MKAMILAAGLGERLHPLTTDRSKVSISVFNRPLILRALQYLSRNGIHEVVINRHRFADSIALALLGQTPPDTVIRYSDEIEILGTAGGIRRVADAFRDETFVVINSDFMSDIDLDAVIQAHRKSGRLGTLVLTPPGTHFTGAVRREPKSGRVLSLHPAPIVPRDFAATRRPVRTAPRAVPMDETGPYEFTGLQILEPAVLDRIPSGRRSDLVRDLYMPIVQEGKLGAVVHDHFWWEFGTIERFLLGHITTLEKGLDGLHALLPSDDIKPGNVKGAGMMMTPGFIAGDRFNVLIDPAAQVSSSASFEGGVVIGPRCRVGAGARLTDSVILDGAVVGDGSDMDRVVLGPGIQAPPNTRLFRCAIGKGDAAIKVPGSSQRSWQGYILRPLSG
jgi:NDP-sugar pyrophosphorylase family protein